MTAYGKFEFRQTTIDEARYIVRQAEEVKSSIGHQATAEIMSKDLDFEVIQSRYEFSQTVDDAALVFKLKKRLEEGQILTVEEIKKIGYCYGLLKRTE